MTKQLIVAIFNSVEIAQKAAHDFIAESEKHIGFEIESCVLVQKNAAGKVILLDSETRSFWGAIVGAISGTLIGMLDGPVGAVAGLTAGVGAGAVADALHADVLDREFVQAVSSELFPSGVALLVEAKELTPFAIDNIVQGFQGKVFRKPIG